MTVQDVEPPVITCPADVTVNTDPGTCEATGVELGTAEALDNCVTVSVSNDAPDVFPKGDTLVTWTATDDSGNTATCQQTVLVIDDELPVITCPADVTVECPADTSVAANGSATATDNCDPSLTITFADNSVPGCGNTEVITRTWTTTDTSGNNSSCVQVITVQDTTPPVFTITPQDTTVECDGSGNQQELGAWLAGVVAKDGCGTVTISNNFTGLSDDCGSTGSATVTWTAVDECGNSVSASATFTVEDTTVPVIELIGNSIVTIECHTGTYTELGATALDQCDTTPIAVVIGGDVVDVDTPGTYVITYDAVDDCGNNAAQVTRIVNVVDTTRPVVSIGDMVEIWPTNHKYHGFNLSDLVVSVEDICAGLLDIDAVGRIISIYSDEPEDAQGKGDGKTTDDIIILGNSSFKVRAEKEGKGNGRVYGVSFEVTDPAGNTTLETCYVGVPHDNSGAQAVNDGAGAGYTLP